MTSTVMLGHSFGAHSESATGSQNDMHTGLHLITCKIKFISKWGGHVDSMQPLLHYIIQEKPQIIFIHIGENDISVELQNGVQVAREIISLAHDLVTQSIHNRLYMGGPLFQFKGGYINFYLNKILEGWYIT